MADARREEPLSGLAMYDLLAELWPLHRTLNSEEMGDALEKCKEYLDDADFKIHCYTPRSDALTWWIPERYKVNEAWLEVGGERIADFMINPLHLVSYSLPTRIEGTLGEIRDHLWTCPERPNAIPWQFKYYERSWGFCVRSSDLDRFDDDARVNGVIDVEFTKEDFRLGEVYLDGADDDILFLTNICHPMQVNDSLSGLVVGLEMARRLSERESRRHGFRLLVVPETIGTIAWLSSNEEKTQRARYAWFCEMVGHDNSFILQHSRQGVSSLIDRAFLVVLKEHRSCGDERTGSFREVVASDEMVTNGPGFDIPTPSLTRWPYPEYHTSDDNPSIIKKENLEETLSVFLDLWDALEENYYPRRRFKGPVMLSRFDLWVDWRDDRALNLATEKMMFMLEGDKSIIDIAFELDLPLNTVRHYIERYVAAGLVEKNPKPWNQP